ncbi:MAG: 4Fe-4S binding protein [Chloroflexi bacterium]|nr:4Fe-4S binding protein [Chloroflexota bacterium]
MFIELKIDIDRCRAGQPCRACIESCPVDIFVATDGLAAVVADNQDECTLCDLCLQRCPTEAVTLTKLY